MTHFKEIISLTVRLRTQVCRPEVNCNQYDLAQKNIDIIRFCVMYYGITGLRIIRKSVSTPNHTVDTSGIIPHWMN